MAEQVVVAVDDHVATVTLNRPGKHNALDLEMFEALGEAGRSLATDATVRAVVLQGAGANFCAGIDTSMFQSGGAAISPANMAPGEDSPANLFQRAAYTWRELPVPVICAITGIAYGAGLQVALGADLRYASPDARLSIMEIKWGIIPDMSITTTLQQCMPADRLKELAFTGRVVGAEEACQLGLVTAACDDPREKAREMAAEISSKSPDAVRAIKQLFHSAMGLPDADALRLEADLQLSVLGKTNQVEAVTANVEGRAPDFIDP